MPRRDVVGLHLRQVEMLPAVGTETHLTLVGRQFLRIGEGSNRQVFLFACEDIRIDARLFGYIVVEDEAFHLVVNLFEIKYLVFELLVEPTPIHAFHDFLALLGGAERGLNPSDDRLEELPQRGRARVVLMVRHIDLDIAVRNPRDGRFEIVLTDGRTREVVAPDFGRRRTVLAEITFGIAHPRAGIHGVAQLLLGEFLSRYIDGFEPLEFLAVGAAANIDLQLVVEDLLLLVGLEVVEIAEVEGEVAVDVLADADGALLAVDDFEGGNARRRARTAQYITLSGKPLVSVSMTASRCFSP